VDSNRIIASTILESILAAQSGKLSLRELEQNIDGSLPAIDSTFPRGVRALLGGLVASICKRQNENGAAALNTPREYDYDENEGGDILFNEAASSLRAYLNDRLAD
jgi:hypothetical protein